MIAHRSIVRARLADDSTFGVASVALAPDDRLSATQAGLATAVVVLAIVGVLGGSPAVLVGGPSSIWVVHRVRDRRRHQRDRRRSDRSVIDLVDHLAQQLRGGRSLASAIELTINTTDAISVSHPTLDVRLRPVRQALASGERLGRALERADVDGLVALELLLASVRLLLENGGPAAVSLDRVGETLRLGVAARDEAASQAGQATASALLLAALPLVFAVLIALAEPAVAELYLTSWTGAACIVSAGALSYWSWWWIDRVVHR